LSSWIDFGFPSKPRSSFPRIPAFPHLASSYAGGPILESRGEVLGRQPDLSPSKKVMQNVSLVIVVDSADEASQTHGSLAALTAKLAAVAMLPRMRPVAHRASPVLALRRRSHRGTIVPVEPDGPLSTKGGWRVKARRRRGQFPEPREVNGQWKMQYRVDVEQEDGSIGRVVKTKCLGPVHAMTYTQAKKEAARFLQPINDVEEGIEHSNKTMRHLIAKWEAAAKPNMKKSTQMAYEWAFKRLSAAFGGAPLQAIGKADVQEFLTAASKQLSPESVRDLRARLRGLLSAAEDWGWIKTGCNPAKGRFRMPHRSAARKKIVLTPEQFWRLAGELREPYQTAVTLAVFSGLRRGELGAARREDYIGGKLRVDESVYCGVLDTPKTPKSNRMVDLGAIGRTALEKLLAKKKDADPRVFIFGQRAGRPADLKNALRRHIKPAARRAGVPAVSWHDLRHTYTTWGRFVGVAPEQLRDQLGHSSVNMTMDVYTHLTELAAALGRSFEGGGIAEKIEKFAAPPPQPPQSPAGGKVIEFRRKVAS
jgi:integrase